MSVSSHGLIAAAAPEVLDLIRGLSNRNVTPSARSTARNHVGSVAIVIVGVGSFSERQPCDGRCTCVGLLPERNHEAIAPRAWTEIHQPESNT